jgi:Flp pilus assembly protein TadG
MILGRQRRKNERGSILILCAICLVVLLLFVGLALDFGRAYLTKARLGKAVDAAALTGVRNVAQGTTQVQALAKTAFAMNYGPSPVPTVTVTTDANNNTYVNVSATATINTAFIGLLPAFKTLNVSDTGQSVRPPAVVTFVLDRSGSMTLNGGATAVPPAVIDGVVLLNSSVDQVAVVSFSSDARTEVPLTTNFQNSVNSAVNSMCFGGATWSYGGLQLAQTIETSAIAVPNQVKAVIFFTDGWANTNQDVLSGCTNAMNYGGCAPPEAAVGWCDGSVSFWKTSSDGSCGQISNLGSCGTGFYSQYAKATVSFTDTNVTNDATYRTLQLANTMRSQGIYVYSIGLGDKINQTFMQQMANDPAYPATYDPTQKLDGLFAWAPDCPGTLCAGEVDQAFTAIINQILLRLAR